MPELPEVEALRESLVERLVGDRFRRVVVRERRLRRPIDRRALQRLVGAAVCGVERRAKYLRIRTDAGRSLVVHLGMSGRLVSTDDGAAEAHEHVTWTLASGRMLRYRDPRRFGLVYVVSDRTIERHPDFASLGVEPLDATFDAHHLHACAAGRRGPVKSFLMDQRVVVGVGNIYASEVLFRARVSPRRRVDTIGPARWARIADATRAVLAAAIDAGGTTIRDYVGGRGAEGRFQHELAVYGRADAPCVACGHPVRRSVMAGRATYACGRCQR